jgi:hypothetical protein
MIEDGIPEILAELSLGHEVAGMRGLYSHVSEQMRQELKDKLQARWERSLQARFELNFYSLVRALDERLPPAHENGHYRDLDDQILTTSGSNTAVVMA